MKLYHGSNVAIDRIDLTLSRPGKDFGKVGAQIRNFKNGNIDLDELLRRIKYLKGITFQYYFGTEAAIQTLHKL